jgi:hypothetical protein
MLENDSNTELFEKYRNEELSDSELRELEARLAYDGEFKSAFDSYQSLEKSIKQHFRDKMKADLKTFDQQMRFPTRKRKGRIRVFALVTSIAAAFVLLFYVFKESSLAAGSNVAVEYWPYEEGLPVRMSTNGKYDEAMNAYKQEQWSKANELLIEIDTDTANYFLGVIAFQEKKYQNSSSYLSKVSQASSYYDEAQFRLAIVLNLLGENDQSIEILQMLITQKTDFSAEATSLLYELK